MRWISTTMTVAMVVCPLAVHAQSSSVSLSAVAARDGYTMRWMLPERSAALYRPGVVIVLRPGAVLYEVNDRVETSDAAPRYINGDLLVSQSLAARLGEIATSSSRTSVARAETAPSQNFRGALSVDIHPLSGDEAVTINGQAPAGAPVTLTLLATISSDLPTIVVSRHDVQPDVNGRFSVAVPIASDYTRGSILRVLATSAPGVTPATAQVYVGPPNGDQTLPLDQWPPR